MTVVWTNSTAAPHTSTSDGSSAVTWDSSIISPGQTFHFTFMQTGTFHYHCNVHPTMHGTIVVTS
jgi:plastocyanin